MKNVAVFASGRGSNAIKIYEYSQTSSEFQICGIYSNKPKAGVLPWAESVGLNTVIFDRNQFYHATSVLEKLNEQGTDLIVLAGFLWLIPTYLIEAFPGRILNIHPALLPRYGGKGMYGRAVHKKVLENQDLFSGPTIHLVNENYDEGRLLFQAKCPVRDANSAEEVASAVLKLEHYFYPRIVEGVARYL